MKTSHVGSGTLSRFGALLSATRTSAALIIGGLFSLLLVLAVQQYRWITSVAEAERQRQQAVVHLAVTHFAAEFNGEVSRAVLAIALGQPSSANPRRRAATGYRQWQQFAPYPRLVREVLVAEPR